MDVRLGLLDASRADGLIDRVIDLFGPGDLAPGGDWREVTQNS